MPTKPKQVSEKKLIKFVQLVRESMADVTRSEDSRDLVEFVEQAMIDCGIPTLEAVMDNETGDVTYNGVKVVVKR